VQPAIAQFEHVNRVNPKIATNHYYLGRALLARGDVEGAKKAYATALQLEPGLKDLRMELAALTGEKPDDELLAARIAELKVALQRDAANVSIRNALARAYLVRGQMQEAETEFKQILDTAPAFAPANLSMGLIRLQQRRPDEAAEFLAAVVRANPGDIRANMLLAEHFANKGNRERAVQHLEAIRRVSPSFEASTLQLARLYSQVGRGGDGLALAREVVTANPKAVGGHFVIGEIQLQRGQPKAAVDSLTTALRLSPEHGPAQLALANAYERSGDVDRALTEYRRAQTLMPKEPAAYNNVAWIHASSGRNLDEALRQARKAHELSPNSAAVLDTLGYVHFRRGEFGQAEPLLRRAAELSSSNATIQYHLGMTLYRLARSEEAAAALQRSLQIDERHAAAAEARRVLGEIKR
jgi:Flp pilus assembly protein TadD